MADVDGTWDTIVKTPIGEQKATLIVKTDGATFTGSNVGPMGSIDIKDGAVDGDTLKWTMSVTAPMPMKLNCTATVDGDAITGSVSAGAFGTFPMNGTRAA